MNLLSSADISKQNRDLSSAETKQITNQRPLELTDLFFLRIRQRQPNSCNNEKNRRHSPRTSMSVAKTTRQDNTKSHLSITLFVIPPIWGRKSSDSVKQCYGIVTLRISCRIRKRRARACLTAQQKYSINTAASNVAMVLFQTL